MIVLKVIGGLGNQMFQYALMKSLELDGFDVYADLSEFGKDGLSFHNGFELEHDFSIQLPRASRSQINKVKNSPSLLYYCRKAVNILYKKPLPHYRENDFISQTLIADRESLRRKDLYLDGYWQSERFFLRHKEEIRSAFTFPEIINEKNRKTIGLIEASNSVSIHVRGGDYLSNPAIFKKFGCICSEEYYQKAISHIRDKIESPKFFIFSNDFDWVNEKLDLKEDEKVYIDWNSGEMSYRDMQLMSLCKHHIIANSSFSWWGAWLSKDEGFTLAPTRWRGDKEQEDIYCPKWIRI